MLRSAIAAVAFLLGTTASAQGDEPKASEAERSPPLPTAIVRLHPLAAAGEQVKAIEVRIELPQGMEKVEKFSIAAPIVYASVTGIADRIEGMKVRDANGDVVLQVRDDEKKPGGFPYYRHWEAQRKVTYPLTISYRALPEQTPPVRGPQFSFRAHDGGISAAGSGFLAVPEGLGVLTCRVSWDLSSLAHGSIAESTFGDGDFEKAFPIETLLQGYYMAGSLGRYAPEADKTFAAYWLGRQGFDAEREMRWAHEVYAFQQQFFGKKSPFRIFLRSFAGLSGNSGTALQNSFMMCTPAEPSRFLDITPTRHTIAHEMMHMFVGAIGTGSVPWYQEGLTEFYTYRLLLKSGHFSVAEFLDGINRTARGYYESPFRNTPAAELDKLGFSRGVGGGSSQNLPYNRGRLYFALVDSRIRTVSGGKRTLDDVIVPLLKKRDSGERFEIETLSAAFEKEYGPLARMELESINVDGKAFDPPADSFGFGFERRAKKYKTGDEEVDGFEWVRDPMATDERIRQLATTPHPSDKK